MEFYAPRDPKALKKEREKARQLKASKWWQLKLNEGTCYYCEQPFTASELTMDHKVPLARGGSSSKENIVPSCKVCNSQKGTRTAVDEVLEKLRFAESQSDSID